jgi:glycerophosphoryl diester phosphodiesterase
MKKKILTLLLLILFISIMSYDNTIAKASPSLNKKSLTLSAGTMSHITIKNASSCSYMKWSSSDKDIAKVDSKTGYVTGINKGSCKIYLKYRIGKSKKTHTLTCKITVKKKPIFYQFQTLAHALGGLEDKYVYSNSKEAFYSNYQLGQRFFEVDLTLSSDSKVVCTHGWKKKDYTFTGIQYSKDKPMLSYDDFMGSKVQSKYTTIDVSTIAEFIKNYPDSYFVFDLKPSSNLDAMNTTLQILEAFNNDKNLLSHVMMQVNSINAYKGVASVYKFSYMQYLADKNDIDKLSNIITFCKKNHISSISMEDKYITKSRIRSIKTKGLYISTYTVDNVKHAKKLLSMGVDVVCSNFIIDLN